MSIDKTCTSELDIPKQQLEEPINQLEQEIGQGKRGVENILDSNLINVEEYDISKIDPLKYKIIEEFISSGNFTCEKIDVINTDLTIEQLISIGGEYLSHIGMTASKLTVIGYMLGKEDIERIGPKKLALMSIEELNVIV